MADLAGLAQTVDDAARQASAIPQLTESAPLTPEQSYRIQALSVGRRLARGERRVGVKMGLTSRAKMIQVGVSEVIWGRLTDGMRIADGGTLERTRFVHPRIEPEVAFLLRRPLSGELSPVEALAAVEAVAPAMEVIDSRYRDFKFSLADVVADNCSSAAFVIGPWAAPSSDIANLGMLLEVDGRVVQVGSSAAILGHPLRSLVAAARLSGQAGEALDAGWIVLAGGATAAHPLAAGMSVRTVMQALGSVALRVA
ncbi:MAG: 4-oxalocrotonate decarboxylase [Alphaproteobacteria bacterium]|nr:4-oxalocrotonate decarboxylase [Alphaproteobacteria bacterium]